GPKSSTCRRRESACSCSPRTTRRSGRREGRRDACSFDQSSAVRVAFGSRILPTANDFHLGSRAISRDTPPVNRKPLLPFPPLTPRLSTSVRALNPESHSPPPRRLL